MFANKKSPPTKLAKKKNSVSAHRPRRFFSHRAARARLDERMSDPSRAPR
jgi:hypothetical protein